jgi:hypothetical protein
MRIHGVQFLGHCCIWVASSARVASGTGNAHTLALQCCGRARLHVSSTPWGVGWDAVLQERPARCALCRRRDALLLTLANAVGHLAAAMQEGGALTTRSFLRALNLAILAAHLDGWAAFTGLWVPSGILGAGCLDKLVSKCR